MFLSSQCQKAGDPAPVDKARVGQAVEQAVRLAGRLGHDFGNYLTGILGFTELTLKHVPEGSLSQRYLKEVWQSAKDGASWVSQLQSLNRGHAPRPEATELAGLVREEEERLKPLWGDAVVLSTSLESPLPLIDVESEALGQVLARLLDNAREAIPGRGAVTLAARAVQLGDEDCQALLGNARPGRFVEITISDTGVGLPADMQQRLFADFFFTTKPRHRGLGLVTVFWIVQLHRGALRFGPHPNQGSAVRVFLPVAPGPLPDAVVKRPASHGKEGHA